MLFYKLIHAGSEGYEKESRHGRGWPTEKETVNEIVSNKLGSY